MNDISILLNGQKKALPENQTVSQALTLFGYQEDKVAVAMNGEFVARANYCTLIIQPKDDIEVVSPMQGG